MPATADAAIPAAMADQRPYYLTTALALSQGSVRRALKLVSSDGIALYNEIAAALAALPDIDGQRLHRQV